VITIYTDGAAKGNPGPGGFGAVLISGKHRKEISQGFKLTTNNRMELLSVISALEALKKDGQQVTIYSDSQYVVHAVEKGCLWQRFLKVFRRHKVKFVWVRGHADNALNNYCDQLAVSAAEGFNLINDEGYNPDVNGDS
jgi:ribonuclease HI